MTRYTVLTASAGSGKTHRLTEELSARVRGGIAPSQLIATTFTIKAAAELTERVRARLLDDGLLDAARAASTAMIGTVNSVAGRIVTDYAIDAGLSPDLRVIPDQEQRRLFSLAVDSVISAAEAEHRDLLHRLDHLAPPDATGYGAGQSWVAQVQEVANAARVNRIGPEQLRAAAAASWAELSAALPEPGSDDRSRWAGLVGAGVRELQALLAGSTDEHGAFVKGGGIKRATSVAPVRRAIAAFGRFHAESRPIDRVTWNDWRTLAKLNLSSRFKTEDGDVDGADAKRAFASLSAEVEETLLANPVLQADLHALVQLVIGTAATCLETYAQYKEQLGLLDFIDQETRAVELVRTDERVRSSLRERFRVLAVDEFQDTSPLQLDLFLALGDLVDEVIWVGDPKQTIYGFRDADPALMAAALDRITASGGTTGTLMHSWRSSEAILNLTNAVFTPIFHGMRGLPAEQVRLSVPEPRREIARHGAVETWGHTGSGKESVEKAATAIARGVRDLLDRRSLRGGEVAVLVRDNRTAERIATALTAEGIPATGAGRPLLASREGQVLRAGLALAVDPGDTLALAELVALLPDHAAHATWFEDLAAVERDRRRGVLEGWWADPALVPLSAVRRAGVNYTPIELVEAVADALDLPQRIQTWTDPQERLQTLDGVRQVAVAYAEGARSRHEPVTLTGFVQELTAGDAAATALAGPDTVQVTTMHGAKGLQWAAVVTVLPAPRNDAAPAGVRVTAPAALDLDAPLAGRELRWWPAVLPFFAPWAAALLATTVAEERRADEIASDERLLYVSLTRARETQVLVPATRSAAHTVLNALGTAVDGAPWVTWDEDGIRLADGTVVPAEHRVFSSDEEANVSFAAPRSALAATDVPQRPAAVRDRVDRRFRASAVPSNGYDADVRRVATLGEPLVSGGGRDWDRVGEAVHAYLATPHPALDAVTRQRVAERIVARWGVTDAVTADVLLSAGARWTGWVEATFPGAIERTEQPITWWNDEDQVMEGWIDDLLALPGGGLVLVDHKTYPGDDPEGHIRRHYLGQLASYAQALADATGAPPARVLLHLPLRGEVWEVAPR